MLFTVAEWAEVRQGHKHAHLVARSENHQARTLTKARRLLVLHDGDGEPIGTRKELVREARKDGGEPRPVVLTVTAVEEIDVYGEEPALPTMRCLGLPDAHACGQRTVANLRAAWKAKYPRSEFARLVWFVRGDVRDRDLYMSWTGRGGGDYTRNARRALDSDAPVLTPEQYENLGMAATQRETKRRAESAMRLAAVSDSQRMLRLERAREEISAEFARTWRLFEDRVARIENRRTGT